MSLIDTSAWIEYLRDTNSSTCNEVDRLLKLEPKICDVIRMEILAGARDQQHVTQLENSWQEQQLLKPSPLITTMPLRFIVRVAS